MKIPEELKRYSEKELKKLLSEKNVYNTKFLYNKEYDQIDIVERRDRINIYVENGSAYTKKYLKETHEPLEYNTYKQAKISVITDSENWFPETFKKWVIKQFIDCYGETFVDVQDEYIIIWFPEITISNSVEQSLVMRDLYLRFTLYEEDRRIYISGLKRATVTASEFRNRYKFSHCTGDFFDWDADFCFGSTDIARLRKQSNSGEVFSNLRFFLEALKEYLSWESLEGTPYKSIDVVINDRNLWKDARPVRYDSERAVDIVKRGLERFNYDFKHYNGEYSIKLSNETRNKIEEILIANFPEHLVYNLNGRSVIKKDVDKISYRDSKFVFFKNEWKPLTIIEDDEIELPKTIASNILEGVINSIEKEFSQFLTNKKINELNTTTTNS